VFKLTDHRAELVLFIRFSEIGEFVEVEEVSIEDEMSELKQKGVI
jgi:hypothetical protein